MLTKASEAIACITLYASENVITLVTCPVQTIFRLRTWLLPLIPTIKRSSVTVQWPLLAGTARGGVTDTLLAGPKEDQGIVYSPRNDALYMVRITASSHRVDPNLGHSSPVQQVQYRAVRSCRKSNRRYVCCHKEEDAPPLGKT